MLLIKIMRLSKKKNFFKSGCFNNKSKGWDGRTGQVVRPLLRFYIFFFTRNIKSLTRISVKNCVKINSKLKKNVILNVTGWSDRYCLWMRMKITVITDEQATGSHNKFMLIFIVGAPPLL